jgi:AcrR family transcriptional regulator
VRAAAELWAEKDYNETTVEDICAAAGVARSTYYFHFESKEPILIELALATARGVAADLDASTNASTLDQQLTAFVDALVRRMESAPKSLATLVMRQVSAATVTPRPAYGDPVLLDDILTWIVSRGQRRGEIRADVDARDIGEMLAGSTLDALQRWAGESTDRSLRDLLTLRFDLLAAAIRPR